MEKMIIKTFSYNKEKNFFWEKKFLFFWSPEQKAVDDIVESEIDIKNEGWEDIDNKNDVEDDYAKLKEWLDSTDDLEKVLKWIDKEYSDNWKNKEAREYFLSKLTEVKDKFKLSPNEMNMKKIQDLIEWVDKDKDAYTKKVKTLKTQKNKAIADVLSIMNNWKVDGKDDIKEFNDNWENDFEWIGIGQQNLETAYNNLKDVPLGEKWKYWKINLQEFVKGLIQEDWTIKDSDLDIFDKNITNKIEQKIYEVELKSVKDTIKEYRKNGNPDSKILKWVKEQPIIKDANRTVKDIITPILRGFKWYDENDNLVKSNALIPSFTNAWSKLIKFINKEKYSWTADFRESVKNIISGVKKFDKQYLKGWERAAKDALDSVLGSKSYSEASKLSKGINDWISESDMIEWQKFDDISTKDWKLKSYLDDFNKTDKEKITAWKLWEYAWHEIDFFEWDDGEISIKMQLNNSGTNFPDEFWINKKFDKWNSKESVEKSITENLRELKDDYDKIISKVDNFLNNDKINGEYNPMEDWSNVLWEYNWHKITVYKDSEWKYKVELDWSWAFSDLNKEFGMWKNNNETFKNISNAFIDLKKEYDK